MKAITQIPKLSARKADAHKGDFGKILIIGGSVGMSGAVALAGKSALRSGAGLVRIATPETVLPIVASIDPCYTTIALPQDSSGKIAAKALDKILLAVNDNDIIAFGPGIGQSNAIQVILQNLIFQKIKLVIDADGLNNLAKIKNWPDKTSAQLILTPHPGEMKRLWSALLRDKIPDDRTEQAVSFARKANCIVVLKGHQTVVTDGDKFYVNHTGNPGMATAGSGDVLTGAISALWAQLDDSFDAAVMGVHSHGLAGDIAAERTGHVSLIATDIIDSLAQAFKNQ